MSSRIAYPLEDLVKPTPSNRSMSTIEKRRAICSCLAERMFTANPGAVVNASWTDALCSMQMSTSGGSRLREQNALTVIP